MKTFPIGGVHPSDNKKWSCNKAIEVLALPDVVNIPLGQHIGAPATAKVAKGDKVLTGQLIAEATGFMSANIHSPISGTVTAVDLQPNGQGLRQMMITIKREGDQWVEGVDLSPELKRSCDLAPEAIIAKVKGDKMVLITDCTRAGGMPDGEYDLGGQPIFLKGIECRLADGTIAGSVLKLNNAVKNVLDHTDLPVNEVFKMASLNPATAIHCADRIGSLEAGKDADIIITDAQFNIEKTIIKGDIKYES